MAKSVPTHPSGNVDSEIADRPLVWSRSKPGPFCKYSAPATLQPRRGRAVAAADLRYPRRPSSSLLCTLLVSHRRHGSSSRRESPAAAPARGVQRRRATVSSGSAYSSALRSGASTWKAVAWNLHAHPSSPDAKAPGRCCSLPRLRSSSLIGGVSVARRSSNRRRAFSGSTFRFGGGGYPGFAASWLLPSPDDTCLLLCRSGG